jgi:hypothetical protein
MKRPLQITPFLFAGIKRSYRRALFGKHSTVIICAGISMRQPQNRDGLRAPFQKWRVFIVILAICGLTISLATRTFRLKIHQSVSVTSGDAQAKRQHLDRDAARWAPPVPVFTVLQVPTFYPFVAPAGPPIASTLFDESLFDRPPPSC